MTCKDCIHERACFTYSGGICRAHILGDKAETKCGLFKNKADFAEVRRGKWVFFSKDIAGKAFFCSLCGNVEVTEVFEISPLENDCNYCSKCGAIMEGQT